jgi:hypothetical protein
MSSNAGPSTGSGTSTPRKRQKQRSSSAESEPPAKLAKTEDGDAMDKLAAVEEEKVMPVRADEFQTEAEREVAQAKGLDGAAGADEGKMKLVHSVSA